MLPQVVFEAGNPLVQSILEVSGSNPSEETVFFCRVWKIAHFSYFEALSFTSARIPKIDVWLEVFLPDVAFELQLYQMREWVAKVMINWINRTIWSRRGLETHNRPAHEVDQHLLTQTEISQGSPKIQSIG